MKEKDPTFTVRLYNDGVDIAVAIYTGVTRHRVNSNNQFEFIRSTGQTEYTNMRYEVVTE